MNVVNRVLVIAALVGLIVAGLVLASAPESLLARLQYWTVDAVVTPQDRIASAILGGVLVILSGMVLYFELRPQPGKAVVISRMSDGEAALEVQSIAQRIRQQVEALEGVRQAAPQVLSRGRRVDVRMVVLTGTEVDVPDKAAEIGTVVRSSIEKMGVSLGKQQINLRYEASPARSAQRA